MIYGVSSGMLNSAIGLVKPATHRSHPARRRMLSGPWWLSKLVQWTAHEQNFGLFTNISHT